MIRKLAIEALLAGSMAIMLSTYVIEDALTSPLTFIGRARMFGYRMRVRARRMQTPEERVKGTES